MGLFQDFTSGVTNLGSRFLGSDVGQAVLKPFELLGRLEGETLKGNALRQNISEFILPDEIGGYKSTKAERQKASERISLGQALSVRLDSFAENILGRNIFKSLQPTSYDLKTGKLFNVYEEKAREERLGGFNLATGFADLVVGTIASPLVVLGKFGKIGRENLLEKSITTERVIEKADQSILEQATKAKSEYLELKNQLESSSPIDAAGIAERKILENKLSVLKTQADKAVEDLSNVGYSRGYKKFLEKASLMNASQLRKHRVVKGSSDPELLAGLLGETTDIARIDLILRSAGGDINAQRLLAQESMSTFLALQKSREPLGDATRQMMIAKSGLTPHAWADIPENRAIIDAEFKDLQKQDLYLQRAVQAADQKVLEGRMGTSVFNSVESLRASKGRLFSEVGATSNRLWDVQYFKRNPFVATVAVVSWPFRERPAGWIRIKGINSSDSAPELESFLAGIKAWEGAEGIAKRQDIMNRFLQADEIGKRRLLENLEKIAIRDTAKKYGLNEEEVGDILKRLDKERGDAIKFYRSKGYLIDEKGEVLYIPQIATQLADSVPMFDILKFDRLIKARTKRISATREFGASLIVKPADFIDELWRPAVLLRAGYTQRNVLEGLGRAVAAMGSLFDIHSGGDILKLSRNADKIEIDGALANFWKNRYTDITSAILVRQEAARLGNKRVPVFRSSWSQVIGFQRDQIILNKSHIAYLKRELKRKGDDAPNEIMQDVIKTRIANRTAVLKEQNAKLKKFAENSTKQGTKGNRYRRGKGFISYGGYDMPRVFEGDAGGWLLDASSAQSRQALELSSPSNVYAGRDNGKFRSRGFKELNPTEKTEYFAGLARVANRQFRNSKILNKLMSGESIDDVIKYATTKQGRAELRLVGENDPEEYVIRMSKVVEDYIPDDKLRKRIAKEEVSAGELEIILGNKKNLKPIHGDNIEEAPDLRGHEKYKATMRVIFKYIGAIPEDVFVRHPFANAVYKKSYETSIDNAKKQGIKLTDDELQGIITGARRKALQETRRTLYTIERYSNFANVIRFLEPFFAATENTARVWSQLVYKDPSLFGKAGYIYNSPDRAGLVQEDPLTGRTTVTMQIPEWFRKSFGDTLKGRESIYFEKGAANLILQGEDWWRIGDGIFTQFAASELLKKYPQTNARVLLDYFAPQGPSKSAIDVFKPTVWKRVETALKNTDSRDYANDLVLITQIENLKWRNGKRNQEGEPTAKEIADRVSAFAWLRAGVALTSIVSVRFRPEFDFYIQKSREYRTKYGPDAPVRFYQDFPDYFEMFFSLTKNPTGISPTKDAVSLANKYRSLTDKITDPKNGFSPEFLQLITNRSGAPVEFDQTAYVWQLLNDYRTGSGERFRQGQSADDVAVVNDLQRGWIEWTKFKTKLDVILKSRGLDSYNSTEAADLQEIKKMYVMQQQTENEVWWKEYNEAAGSKRPYFFLKALNIAMNDKKFMADRGEEPMWDAFDQYRKERNLISAFLKSRKNAGGAGTLDAKSNADLADLWAIRVEQLKDIDPTGAFTTFYNRFLDGDTFEEIR